MEHKGSAAINQNLFNKTFTSAKDGALAVHGAAPGTICLGQGALIARKGGEGRTPSTRKFK